MSMSNSNGRESIETFHRTLDELIDFADNLKLREHQLEQQNQLELNKQKTQYETQIQIERKANEKLKEINVDLTGRLEKATKDQLDSEQKCNTLQMKVNCLNEEINALKEQNEKKRVRLEQLERHFQKVKVDKDQSEEKIKKLQAENEQLKNPPESGANKTASSTNGKALTMDEVLNLVSKAVEENNELIAAIRERDKEIEKLTKKLDRAHAEDPQVVEQRLLQLVDKLKKDFRMMYENQSEFFMEKMDLLQQEQRDNISSLYKQT